MVQTQITPPLPPKVDVRSMSTIDTPGLDESSQDKSFQFNPVELNQTPVLIAYDSNINNPGVNSVNQLSQQVK